MRTLFLFLDGVGLGKADPDVNPLFRARLPHLRSLLGGKLPHLGLRRIASDLAVAIPLNATLGVEGLPQSGTGQATLFTGVNASKLMGRHFGPYAATPLHPLIESNNIFRQYKSRGRTVCFANAFPKQFFEYAASGKRRLSVTTLSCRYAEVPLQHAESLGRDESVSADITRARWPELGYPDLPIITPREAGKHLWSITARHAFTLFEYWLTDYAGHGRDMAIAVETLERFDGMLGGLLENFDHRECTLILTSDHGNIEDLSTKSHTRNPVPCILAGRKHRDLSTVLKNLVHVTPALLASL
ncbi:MAG: alkaline phosphatase family protein [Ignavibacteriales bacterium]|nr:alkaline phosphatase family protein [Ignavibacteriales bacterium]